MGLRIEDYALIGDMHSAALVGRDGSIDWLCWPRFDSGACFAALLGTPDQGRWQIAPADPSARATRRYRDGSLVLETVFETAEGEVVLTDCMPQRHGSPNLLRRVSGRRGRVAMRLDLAFRFDYGRSVPWVSALPDGEGLRAIAGPDMVVLRAPVPLQDQDGRCTARFTLAEGESLIFALAYGPSDGPLPAVANEPAQAIEDTGCAWSAWAARVAEAGPWTDAVRRSVVTLKALTYGPTGAIVAAPTTSLPEWPGGVRNWDYRYCWLRDATLTLLALLQAGFGKDAGDWRAWLMRATMGTASQIQILYGVAGERLLPEWQAKWLPGYEGSQPVRIGNSAHDQLQLDVFGELMDALHQAHRRGLPMSQDDWALQRALVDHVAAIWRKPDDGMWEARNGPRCFTYSKVMAWAAVDRAISAVEEFGMEGPLDRWRALRQEMHEEICREAFDRDTGSFSRSYGVAEVDASLLLIPAVGFLPPDDKRILGTIAAVERDLLEDGLVRRYRPRRVDDGLPGEEGVFLACNFWLVDAYRMTGRGREARALFERLLALRNDVGLLSEEYDPAGGRMLGNFPQAFSHVALVNSAYALARDGQDGIDPPRA